MAVCIASLIWMTSCAKKDYLVTIKTEYGDIKVVLFDETPQHKASFISLAEDGSYDSTIFHRVINEFMVQGGDINRKPGNTERNNTLIDAEFRDMVHTKGMLAGARTGDNVNPEKKSGTQFYIIHGRKYSHEELEKFSEDTYYGKCVSKLNELFQKGEEKELLNQLIEKQKANDLEGVKQIVYSSVPLIESKFGKINKVTYSEEQYKLYEEEGGAPHLDGEYTIFGQVVEGLAVVDSIAVQRTGPGDQPVKDIYMTMEVEEMPKSKITKLYGYEYPQEDN